MQVLGVKVTTPDASPTTSEPQLYHFQKHSQQQQFLLKTSTFSLTVYLDPTTFQQTLPPMTFLSDPPSSTGNRKHGAASSASPSSPKSNVVQDNSRKEPHSRVNQRSPVIGQDENPFPARVRFSPHSSSSDRKRVRGGNSRTIIVDQGSVWRRSSFFFSEESDNNINDDNDEQYQYDATAAQETEEEGEDGRISRGISKGPRRLSRHRFPHALIHRLYNNNSPSRESVSGRTTTPKTMTAKISATTKRIVAKERPPRLQRLLLQGEQEGGVDETVWRSVVSHNHDHQQQEQQEPGRDVPSARDDDMFYYPTDQDLADMMNYIIDEELSEYFANEMMLHSSSNDMNDNHPNDDSPFETKQPQQQQQSTPASTSPHSSSFVLPALSSDWTQNDIDMARALWNYWEELDAMDLMQSQLESQLDDDNDVQEDIDNGTHNSRQGQLRNRPEARPFKRTLWKGKVKALVKDGSANMSSSPQKWQYDSISGPMMRFPFSGPMPIMPQKWIALMSCPVESADAEVDLDQTGRNPTLPIDASAIIFYETSNGDCRSYVEIDGEDGTLPPLIVLDTLSAQRLILTLDSLPYGTTAMASLAETEIGSSATVPRMNTTPVIADDNKEGTSEAGLGKESTTPNTPDSIEKKEASKAAARPNPPRRRQIVIPMPEIALMVDSFTAGAAIRARRVLVNLGLDTQDNTDEQLAESERRDRNEEDDVDYYRILTGAGVQKASIGPEAKGDPLGQGYAHDQEQNQEKEKEKDNVSGAFILQRHSKTRTRPNRLSQGGQPSSTPSQLLEQVQSLMLLKEYPQYKGHQSPHHRLNNLQQNNINLPLTHPNNTTLSGRVAMVLMSTVCGIGVGMFGALLFVVALKVRLFQSRRSNNSGGLHPLRNATAAQQQQAHQQMRESGVKKVIPLGVLESYGVQTVLQTSSATMVLTAVSEKSKSKMASLSNGPKVYAEDVIEMEEGLEDAEARANARRLRLERRSNRVSGGRQLGLGRDIEEEEEEEEEDESSSDEDDYEDDDSIADQDEQSGSQEHGQFEEEGDDDQVVPEMRSSHSNLSDGGAMDMEQITAAIMTATRQGSYRRVSYSRQGHLNGSTSSFSSSYSSSSSSGSSSSSSSSSMGRALTSSFSSSLSRSSENPQGCTHSITHSHSHSHERRRRRRRRRRRIMSTKEEEGDAKETETKKGELPFANANAQTMCSICLADYEVGEQVRTLPCYHQYHQGCIDPWLLNVTALCPICKRDLFPSPPSTCGSTGVPPLS
ncbi:hypothetical protein BGZ96_000138 [Linnemannia gamsii]|uniref:RING-type domain-containing protein n=1 Tax=Linnemannia gamsii TaxID=64522 RepID=A0ABQ7JQ89_9FUNG|nr:hypothetical protein BGZ96_000138 [Linnemannia gamsii]